MADKKILIVDDSEIDRTILKSILSDDFEIRELDNGYEAYNLIQTCKDDLSAILLAISMPYISGFDVLQFMQESHIDNIPVFLMSGEATEEDVRRAAKSGVADFITKPFDKDDILQRIRSRLGIFPKQPILSREDIEKTKRYITSLRTVYKVYLENNGQTDTHYRNVVELMKILLKRHSMTRSSEGLNADTIDLISEAAYFCDIGQMLIPNKIDQILSKSTVTTTQHTFYGASVVQLNTSKNCKYFVQICAEMCLHHHERYDGKGYPQGIKGDHNSIYSQMCHIVDEFDTILSKFYGDSTLQINFVAKRLTKDDGFADPQMLSLLSDCIPMITKYYKSVGGGK